MKEFVWLLDVPNDAELYWAYPNAEWNREWMSRMGIQAYGDRHLIDVRRAPDPGGARSNTDGKSWLERCGDAKPGICKGSP